MSDKLVTDVHTWVEILKALNGELCKAEDFIVELCALLMFLREGVDSRWAERHPDILARVDQLLPKKNDSR